MQALFNSLGCQNHMGAHSGLDLAGGGEVLQPSLDDLMDLDPMAPLQVSRPPASWPALPRHTPQIWYSHHTCTTNSEIVTLD